jgi:capsule polysaccharide export protein KpsE/RkpR
VEAATKPDLLIDLPLSDFDRDREDDSEIRLVSVAALLWSERVRVRRWLGVGLALSIGVAVLIRNQYESTVSLMPPDTQSISGSAAMLASMAGAASGAATTGLASSLLGAKSASASFIGVIQSRTAEDDLINRFDLRKVYYCKRYLDARRKLAARTRVKEDSKTGILTITVYDRDRQRARDMASAYVDELDKLVAQLSTSSARRERIFLEERLKTVEQDLDGASRELSQFSSRTTTLDVQNQGKTLVDAAAKLQGELIVAESEVRGLEAIYSDGNTRVQAAQARVAELKRQLGSMSGRGERGLSESGREQHEIGGREQSESEQGSGLEPGQLYPSLRRLPLLGVTYYDLYRRVRVQEALYETLTKQYELAKVQEAREIPTVKVLDKPSLAEKKSFPPRLVIVLLGVLTTLLLITARLLFERSWKKLGTDDPRKALAGEMRDALRTFGARWRRAESRRSEEFS